MSESMINLLGTELAKHIKIQIKILRGLIRLAIIEDHGNLNDLNINNLQFVLKNALKNRLKELKIPNIDDIILNLEKVIIANQSILIIACI